MGSAGSSLNNLSHGALLELLDVALQGAGMGVWDWDLRDDRVHFDRVWCQMLGLDPAQTPMHLSTWRSRVHPDDLAQCYRDIEDHLAGRTEHYQNIHRLRHQDGHWVYILDRGSVLSYDESGKPLRFTGIHFDLTPSVQAKQLLAQHDRLERERRMAVLAWFAGGVAHEINSPLQVLTVEADYLLDALRDSAPQAEDLVESVTAVAAMARRAANVVHALRTLGHDPGQENLTAVSLARLLRDAEALCRTRFESGGVRLLLPAVSEDIVVWGRPAELLQLVLILLEGAHAGVVVGGTVRLELAVQPQAVVLAFHGPAEWPPAGCAPAPERGGLGIHWARTLAERNGAVLAQAGLVWTVALVRGPQ